MASARPDPVFTQRVAAVLIERVGQQDGRKRVAQLAQHCRVRLDRNDFSTRRDQGSGQLACASTEVENSQSRRRLERPTDGARRVVRAMLCIRDCRSAE